MVDNWGQKKQAWPGTGQFTAREYTVVAQLGFPFFQDKPSLALMKLVVAKFPSFTRIFIPKLQCAPSARDLGKSLKLFSHPKCYAFIRLSIKWPLPVRDRPCARHQEHHSKQDWHDLCLHGTYSLRWEMESIQIIYNYNEWWNKRSRVQWWRIMREARRVYLQRVSREGLSMKGTQKQRPVLSPSFFFKFALAIRAFSCFHAQP